MRESVWIPLTGTTQMLGRCTIAYGEREKPTEEIKGWSSLPGGAGHGLEVGPPRVLSKEPPPAPTTAMKRYLRQGWASQSGSQQADMDAGVSELFGKGNISTSRWLTGTHAEPDRKSSVDQCSLKTTARQISTHFTIHSACPYLPSMPIRMLHDFKSLAKNQCKQYPWLPLFPYSQTSHHRWQLDWSGTLGKSLLAVPRHCLSFMCLKCPPAGEADQPVAPQALLSLLERWIWESSICLNLLGEKDTLRARAQGRATQPCRRPMKALSPLLHAQVPRRSPDLFSWSLSGLSLWEPGTFCSRVCVAYCEYAAGMKHPSPSSSQANFH